jgi:hypothetical protein
MGLPNGNFVTHFPLHASIEASTAIIAAQLSVHSKQATKR